MEGYRNCQVSDFDAAFVIRGVHSAESNPESICNLTVVYHARCDDTTLANFVSRCTGICDGNREIFRDSANLFIVIIIRRMNLDTKGARYRCSALVGV
jgi:hypothetical protein